MKYLFGIFILIFIFINCHGDKSSRNVNNNPRPKKKQTQDKIYEEKQRIKRSYSGIDWNSKDPMNIIESSGGWFKDKEKAKEAAKININVEAAYRCGHYDFTGVSSYKVKKWVRNGILDSEVQLDKHIKLTYEQIKIVKINPIAGSDYLLPNGRGKFAYIKAVSINRKDVIKNPKFVEADTLTYILNTLLDANIPIEYKNPQKRINYYNNYVTELHFSNFALELHGILKELFERRKVAFKTFKDTTTVCYIYKRSISGSHDKYANYIINNLSNKNHEFIKLVDKEENKIKFDVSNKWIELLKDYKELSDFKKDRWEDVKSVLLGDCSGRKINEVENNVIEYKKYNVFNLPYSYSASLDNLLKFGRDVKLIEGNIEKFLSIYCYYFINKREFYSNEKFVGKMKLFKEGFPESYNNFNQHSGYELFISAMKNLDRAKTNKENRAIRKLYAGEALKELDKVLEKCFFAFYVDFFSTYKLTKNLYEW